MNWINKNKDKIELIHIHNDDTSEQRVVVWYKMKPVKKVRR